MKNIKIVLYLWTLLCCLVVIGTVCKMTHKGKQGSTNVETHETKQTRGNF